MKFYRKKEGLSQAALAERAGTAPNYIALIEVGKDFPSLQMLEKIAYALNIDKNCLALIDSKTLQKKLISSLINVVNENFNEYSLI